MDGIKFQSLRKFDYNTILLSIFTILCIRSLRHNYYSLQVCVLEHLSNPSTHHALITIILLTIFMSLAFESPHISDIIKYYLSLSAIHRSARGQPHYIPSAFQDCSAVSPFRMSSQPPLHLLSSCSFFKAIEVNPFTETSSLTTNPQ